MWPTLSRGSKLGGNNKKSKIRKKNTKHLTYKFFAPSAQRTSHWNAKTRCFNSQGKIKSIKLSIILHLVFAIVLALSIDSFTFFKTPSLSVIIAYKKLMTLFVNHKEPLQALSGEGPKLGCYGTVSQCRVNVAKNRLHNKALVTMSSNKYNMHFLLSQTL